MTLDILCTYVIVQARIVHFWNSVEVFRAQHLMQLWMAWTDSQKFRPGKLKHNVFRIAWKRNVQCWSSDSQSLYGLFLWNETSECEYSVFNAENKCHIIFSSCNYNDATHFNADFVKYVKNSFVLFSIPLSPFFHISTIWVDNAYLINGLSRAVILFCAADFTIHANKDVYFLKWIY